MNMTRLWGLAVGAAAALGCSLANPVDLSHTGSRPDPAPAAAPAPPATGTNPIGGDGLAEGQSRAQALGLKERDIVSVLPRDAIPAILDPQFDSVTDAEAYMRPSEQVMTLSIGGDSRAYPINMLSVHEIVNDTVGGRRVAVTY